MPLNRLQSFHKSARKIPANLLKEARDSCRGLRMMAGLAGFGLPPILFVGGSLVADRLWLDESLSAYYHGSMRDFFVGILFTIGFILLVDLGDRDQQPLSRILGPLAGLSAIGTAVTPTWPPGAIPEPDALFIFSDPSLSAGYRHIVFASLLFLALILITLFVFPVEEEENESVVDAPARSIEQTSREEQLESPHPSDRNPVYYGAGLTMTVFGLAIFIYYMIPKHLQAPISAIRPVFWLETFMIWAFAAAWWTKSREPHS